MSERLVIRNWKIGPGSAISVGIEVLPDEVEVLPDEVERAAGDFARTPGREIHRVDNQEWVGTMTKRISATQACAQQWIETYHKNQEVQDALNLRAEHEIQEALKDE